MSIITEMALAICGHQDCVFNHLCQCVERVGGVVRLAECEAQKEVRAALAAAEAAGYVMVPIEPTEKMWREAEAKDEGDYAGADQYYSDIWEFMIAARPSISEDK